MTVGIYDSGCGGLTVLNALLERDPTCAIAYYADAKYNPWGSQPPHVLKDRLCAISQWFDEQGVTHVVTGCNTSVGLFGSQLTGLFQRPVTTLFDHTRHHYTASKYTVLSTEHSARNRLFSLFLKPTGAVIREQPCPQVAHWIETNQLDRATDGLAKHIQPTSNESIILGCTHYPLILNRILARFPQVTVLDPSQFLHWPRPSHIQNASNPPVPPIFFTSGDPKVLMGHIYRYCGMGSYWMNGEYQSVE